MPKRVTKKDKNLCRKGKGIMKTKEKATAYVTSVSADERQPLITSHNSIIIDTSVEVNKKFTAIAKNKGDEPKNCDGRGKLNDIGRNDTRTRPKATLINTQRSGSISGRLNGISNRYAMSRKPYQISQIRKQIYGF